MILCPFWHNAIICWPCMSCVYVYVSVNYSKLFKIYHWFKSLWYDIEYDKEIKMYRTFLMKMGKT